MGPAFVSWRAGALTLLVAVATFAIWKLFHTPLGLTAIVVAVVVVVIGAVLTVYHDSRQGSEANPPDLNAG